VAVVDPLVDAVDTHLAQVLGDDARAVVDVELCGALKGSMNLAGSRRDVTGATSQGRSRRAAWLREGAR
jgi:hypothetical protein